MRAEQERQAREQHERQAAQSATVEQPRPRPRPTPGPTPMGPRPTPMPQAPAAQAPSAPSAGATWQPPAWQPPQPQPAQAWAPQPQPQPQVTPPAERRDDAAAVPPRLVDLRSTLLSWLSTSYRDVRLESNGWITIPDIGPSVIQIETSIIQGGHLKAEVFAPLVLDVPLSGDLFRYVGLEGGRFHFGVISLDAGEDGTDELALLQFSHSLLADDLQRDELLAVVWLVAATVMSRAPELKRRFGGMLFAEIAR